MFKDQITRYKFAYYRKNEIDNEEGFLVQIEVYRNGLRRCFSTGIYLIQEQWNGKKNDPKVLLDWCRKDANEPYKLLAGAI